MRPPIIQELKQAFNVHTLRHEAKHRLTGRQWDQYRQLTSRCQKVRTQEQKLFNERYHSRIDQESRSLLRDNAAKNRHFKPLGQQDDLFDRAALLKQSDQNIRKRHEQRLAKITQIEEQAIETLLQRSTQANVLKGQSKDAFTCVADRRSGNERRSIPNRAQSRSVQRQSR